MPGNKIKYSLMNFKKLTVRALILFPSGGLAKDIEQAGCIKYIRKRPSNRLLSKSPKNLCRAGGTT